MSEMDAGASSDASTEVSTCDSVEQSNKTELAHEIFGPDSPLARLAIDLTPKTAKLETEDAQQQAQPQKKKKKKKIPNIRIFYGTFVHSTDTEPLVILRKWLVGVKHGKIVFSQPGAIYNDILKEYKLQEVQKEVTICLGEGTFMIPGFVDAHTDVVSFLAKGIQDLETLETDRSLGSKDRIKVKLRLVHDDRIANKLFSKVAERTVSNGTTSVAYCGSHTESACRLLSDTLGRLKQRACVGINLAIPEEREDMHIFQVTKARDVVNHILRKQNSVVPHMIVPTLLPSWLEEKLASIQNETGASIKISLGEQKGHKMVSLEKQTPLQYHSQHGLLNDNTIALHSPGCTESDLRLLIKANASLVYCPALDISSNCYTNIRLLAGCGVKLGLGTDLENSGSLSMLTAIRQCIHVAKQPIISIASAERKCSTVPPGENHHDIHEPLTNGLTKEPAEEEEEEELNEKDVTYRDFFRLATLGGAKVLGLEDKVGSFEVGKEFDALLVDPFVPDSTFFATFSKDLLEDLLERFLFSGDDRNITAVYISGQRVK